MKKTLNYILDKLFWIVLFFEALFKKNKQQTYLYQRDFLGKESYQRDLEEIFQPVTEIVKNNFQRIFLIKSTLYSEALLIKLKCCIENNFWGIFAFASLHISEANDENYFAQPSIRIYLIVDSEDEKTITIVKSTVKHFQMLAYYQNVNSPLSVFKDKKLVYSRNKDFISV